MYYNLIDLRLEVLVYTGKLSKDALLACKRNSIDTLAQLMDKHTESDAYRLLVACDRQTKIELRNLYDQFYLFGPTPCLHELADPLTLELVNLPDPEMRQLKEQFSSLWMVLDQRTTTALKYNFAQSVHPSLLAFLLDPTTDVAKFRYVGHKIAFHIIVLQIDTRFLIKQLRAGTLGKPVKPAFRSN
jgi:hypothetical protein